MENLESGAGASDARCDQATADGAGIDAVGRRSVLAAGAALAATAAAPSVAGQSDDLETFLEDVPNYDGEVADYTDSDEVRVAVGAADGFQYDPPVIRVEVGTTVVWEWTGEGGGHDVTEVDDAFASELTDDAGHTFEQTFESVGEYRYVCTPHEAMGMKGAVLVELPDPTPEIEEYLAEVDNFDGIVDQRGADEVTVSVGAGDGFQFDPPAVRVDPGATVVWEWTGEGGGHDVTEVDDAFASELTDEAGHTFEQTFESPGHYRYVCTPHEAMEMKGAVVVGDAGADGGAGGGAVSGLTVGGVTALLLAPLGVALALVWRELQQRSPGRSRSAAHGRRTR